MTSSRCVKTEANAEEDRKQFELVEAKNKASQQVYQLEKLMSENDESSLKQIKAMNKAIEKVKTAEGEDVDAIKQASDELDSATKPSKILYEQAEAAGGSVSLKLPKVVMVTTTQLMRILK